MNDISKYIFEYYKYVINRNHNNCVTYLNYLINYKENHKYVLEERALDDSGDENDAINCHDRKNTYDDYFYGYMTMSDDD